MNPRNGDISQKASPPVSYRKFVCSFFFFFILSKLTPADCSLHLQWLSCIGGALDAKEVWISAIRLHLNCGQASKARQLLETVQHLPLKDLREILFLAEDPIFQDHFPDLSITPSVPTLLDLRIQRRQTFLTEAEKNKPSLSSNHEQLKIYYQLWRGECDAVVRDEHALSPAQREQQWGMGFDFSLYIYQCAWSTFSQFANAMEYALIFARFYRDRIITLLDTIRLDNPRRFPADQQAPLENRLRQLVLWLQAFSHFPNLPTVSIGLASYSFSVFEYFQASKNDLRPTRFLSKQETVCAVVQLLQDNCLVKEPLSVSLLGVLADAASPPSYEQLPVARTLFQNVECHLLSCLPLSKEQWTEENQSHARNLVQLWKNWALTESRLMQYNTGVKRIQDALANPLVREDQTCCCW